MKLGYVCFFVLDVKATVDFYEAAFGLKLRYLHPTGEYAELETGSTLLAFTGEKLLEGMKLLGSHQIRRNRVDQDPIGGQIALITDNIEADYSRALAAGARPVAEIDLKPWGQKTAYVLDNNHLLVELCTPPIR